MQADGYQCARLEDLLCGLEVRRGRARGGYQGVLVEERDLCARQEGCAVLVVVLGDVVVQLTQDRWQILGRHGGG